MAKGKTISGGGLVSKILKAEGVSTVFGIIDGTYFGFYSSLGKDAIRLVTPRHETSAAHMAGAYARVTGGLGVCMASNGPGVANVLPVSRWRTARETASCSSRVPGVPESDTRTAAELINTSTRLA